MNINQHSDISIPPITSSLYAHQMKTHLPQEDETIISFESPYQLKELGYVSSNSNDEPDHFIDQQVFNIRLVNSARKREKASLLIKKKYSWRGYSVDETIQSEPNRITLLAETAGETVGTMTLCLDTGTGLPAEENFSDKLEELRSQKRTLSEPSRLAIDDKAPKRILAALLHIAYIYAYNIHGCTDWIAEVNPRHVNFYKRMLGFQEVEKERTCTRVGAPAVLLNLDLSYMAEQIQKFGGSMVQQKKDKSYYPFFFPISDEAGITGRLKTGRT